MRLIIAFIGCALSLAAQVGSPFVGVGNGRHWYIDQTNGSDSNTGLSPTQPFKTIGKLFAQTQQNYDHIMLHAGTCEWWREAMIYNATGLTFITVSRYGSGAAPLLDTGMIMAGTDACGNTGSVTWTLDTGTTWVTTVTTPVDNPGFSNFMINGAPLRTLATSQANCEATPNSYYVSNAGGSGATFSMPGGTYQVYYNNNSATNPGSQGNLIEFSALSAGVNGNQTNHMIISGIAGRLNHTNNGSIVCGQHCTLVNVTALDGGKHNALVADGSNVNGLTLNRAWYNSLNSELIVVFDANSLSLGGSLNNITASLTTFDGTINTMFSHIGGGSGLGNAVINNVTITNAPFGSPTGTNAVVNNVTMTGGGTMTLGGSGTSVINNMNMGTLVAGQQAINTLAASTGAITLNNFTAFCITASNGCLRMQGAIPLTIANSNISNTQANDNTIFINNNVQLPSISITGTNFPNPGLNANFISSNTSFTPLNPTFANNVYHFGNGAFMRWGGTFYDLANAGFNSFKTLVSDTTSTRTSP